MWLFTKYGFFSVVCGREKNGPSVELDQNTYMVRARKKGHLQNLINNSDILGDPQIVKSEDTDYRYRIIVLAEIWTKVIAKMTSEIDYGNFKNECFELDKDYVKYLSSVWQTMYEMQE